MPLKSSRSGYRLMKTQFFIAYLKEEINMGLTVDNWFSHWFNLFEANDCHRGTSNHEAHIDNEEKVQKLVT